jgi:hypothetical protein
MTIQELATEASRWFTRDKRNDGQEYVHLKDGRPDWLQDLCHEAHGDMMPDDWRYEFIENAIDALAENDDPDDINLEADIYTHDLTTWLGSRADRFAYCEDAVKEYGLDTENFSMLDLLQQGQLMEKREVLDLVRAYLEQRAEEAEDTDAEEEV